MSEFTFLTKEQSYGPNRLEILNKYNKDCEITDLAILLGGKAYEGDFYNPYINWSWWTSTFYNATGIGITKEGELTTRLMEYKDYGGRPAISYSLIKPKCTNKRINQFGILEVEFGYYPQQVANKKVSTKLEEAFLRNNINKTGNKYHLKPNHYLNRNTYQLSYEALSYDEYEYEGKRYIRFLSYGNRLGKGYLSNGQSACSNGILWLEVEPIKWLVDEKTNIALSEKIIFSGVPFHDMDYLRSFEASDIKKFMDVFFSKDIQTDIVSRKEHHRKDQNQRPGIKVKDINADKIKEIVTKEKNKERVKVKTKTK